MSNHEKCFNKVVSENLCPHGVRKKLAIFFLHNYQQLAMVSADLFAWIIPISSRRLTFLSLSKIFIVQFEYTHPVRDRSDITFRNAIARKVVSLMIRSDFFTQV